MSCLLFESTIQEIEVEICGLASSVRCVTEYYSFSMFCVLARGRCKHWVLHPRFPALGHSILEALFDLERQLLSLSRNPAACLCFFGGLKGYERDSYVSHRLPLVESSALLSYTRRRKETSPLCRFLGDSPAFRMQKGVKAWDLSRR